ncbi:MAG: hypothetical protein HWE39_05650 [Oceanospirillaceae bacterium]|nr:hypothetical protein [Oceanospirillaceae bacterium]
MDTSDIVWVKAITHPADQTPSEKAVDLAFMRLLQQHYPEQNFYFVGVSMQSPTAELMTWQLDLSSGEGMASYRKAVCPHALNIGKMQSRLNQLVQGSCQGVSAVGDKDLGSGSILKWLADVPDKDLLQLLIERLLLNHGFGLSLDIDAIELESARGDGVLRVHELKRKAPTNRGTFRVGGVGVDAARLWSIKDNGLPGERDEQRLARLVGPRDVRLDSYGLDHDHVENMELLNAARMQYWITVWDSRKCGKRPDLNELLSSVDCLRQPSSFFSRMITNDTFNGVVYTNKKDSGGLSSKLRLQATYPAPDRIPDKGADDYNSFKVLFLP